MPPSLRHDDRHVGFGDGVHRGGQDRDVEADLAREPAAHIGGRRQGVARGGHEEHIVERQTEQDFHRGAIRARTVERQFVPAPGGAIEDVQSGGVTNARGAA